MKYLKKAFQELFILLLTICQKKLCYVGISTYNTNYHLCKVTTLAHPETLYLCENAFQSPIEIV